VKIAVSEACAMPSPFRADIPDSLRPGVRDARLPRKPPAGFRNMFHEGAAPDAARWRGLGGGAETAHMLAALAERMMSTRRGPSASPFAAGYTYLAQFVAHDLQFSTDSSVYPPPVAPTTPLRDQRLMLETIYGDGPEEDPALYDGDCGAARGDRLGRNRLRVGRFGPGVPPGQRTLPRERPRRGCSSNPRAPLCAADDRNDENPVVAQIAGFFMRLHNVALRRLTRYGDPAERFRAARRVTQACFRAIVFEDLAPALLRPDVRAAHRDGRRLDAFFAASDAMPVEFSHCVFRGGHALVRSDYVINDTVNAGQAVNVQYMIRHTSKRDPDAFTEGRAWPIGWSHFFGETAQGAEPLRPHVNPFLAEAPGLLSDDHPKARRAHLILRDLTRGMEAGPLTVEAMGRALAPAFAGEPGLSRWLGFDASHRGRAVMDWIGDDRALKPHIATLCADPPLYFFALLEAAAPTDQGGGAGRCFGAVGSTVIAEPLYAARDATRAAVEDHPDLAADLDAVIGDPAPIRSMARLVDALTTDTHA
jgi:hypothetical protein